MKEFTILGSIALTALTCLLATHGQAAAAGAARSYVAGNFTLTLDGVAAGFLKSAAGGSVIADAVAESPPTGKGAGIFPKKRLGATRIEPISVDVPFGSKPINDWISASLNGSAVPKNGTISSADFDFNEKTRLAFERARLTQIEIPGCDGASKEPDYIDLVIMPEAVRRQAGNGKVAAVADASKSQKSWLPSNFRLSINGLDTTRVSKVSALIIKPGPTPSISNLVISFPEISAKGWEDWYQEFVVKNAGADPKANDAKEKTGTLEFLTPNRQGVLMKLTFRGLGLVRLAPEKAEANADTIRRLAAEMYVEDVKAEFPSP